MGGIAGSVGHGALGVRRSWRGGSFGWCWRVVSRGGLWGRVDADECHAPRLLIQYFQMQYTYSSNTCTVDTVLCNDIVYEHAESSCALYVHRTAGGRSLKTLRARARGLRVRVREARHGPRTTHRSSTTVVVQHSSILSLTVSRGRPSTSLSLSLFRRHDHGSVSPPTSP